MGRLTRPIIAGSGGTWLVSAFETGPGLLGETNMMIAHTE